MDFHFAQALCSTSPSPYYLVEIYWSWLNIVAYCKPQFVFLFLLILFFIMYFIFIHFFIFGDWFSSWSTHSRCQAPLQFLCFASIIFLLPGNRKLVDFLFYFLFMFIYFCRGDTYGHKLPILRQSKWMSRREQMEQNRTWQAGLNVKVEVLPHGGSRWQALLFWPLL